MRIMWKLSACIAVIGWLHTVSPSTAQAGAIFYRYQNYTDGHRFTKSVKNFKSVHRTYAGTCWETFGRHEDIREFSCTKKANLNDDFRALEITGRETVEVYEHSDFRGRMIRYRGPVKVVLPAWLWDKASSVAIWSSGG